MKVIKNDDPKRPVRDVDWNQPVVVFDPWPFDDEQVKLADSVLYWDGYDWSEGPGWVLDSEIDNVLGVTTLGETFVSARESLEKLT